MFSRILWTDTAFRRCESKRVIDGFDHGQTVFHKHCKKKVFHLCMHNGMVPQSFWIWKFSVTNITMVWFFTGVNSNVYSETAATLELLAANVTREWSIIGVHMHVTAHSTSLCSSNSTFDSNLNSSPNVVKYRGLMSRPCWCGSAPGTITIGISSAMSSTLTLDIGACNDAIAIQSFQILVFCLKLKKFFTRCHRFRLQIVDISNQLINSALGR